MQQESSWSPNDHVDNRNKNKTKGGTKRLIAVKKKKKRISVQKGIKATLVSCQPAAEEGRREEEISKSETILMLPREQPTA